MDEQESKLSLKPINDLLDERFFIPAYQRGYRWSPLMVKQLLDDIWDFKTNMPKFDSKEEVPFYCLQPIVVKEKTIDGKKQWEVIDGQQRLTTIQIILYYFNQSEFKKPKRIFSLSYQTRKDSDYFLQHMEYSKWAEKNIDYFHIHAAYQEIDKWFASLTSENEAIRGDFYTVLINQVKIIWYKVVELSNKSEDAASIDIFTRLNIGKIPLTNAELIKAMFLQKGNFQEDKVSLKQLQIASEWDAIEKELQKKDFWYFIYNPTNPIKYINRIEYIFDLMKHKVREHEKYFTFNEFQKDFAESKKGKERPDIDALWLKVKKYFLCFEQWYSNRELYHLVGFLIDCGKDINKLKEQSEGTSKTSFIKYLKLDIRKQIECQVDELVYNDPRIKKVLLLFNIQTIQVTKNTDMRFPFNRYKEEQWDIEHVRSLTTEIIAGNKRKKWAADILEYFTGETGWSDQCSDGTVKSKREIQQDVLNTLTEEEKDFCNRLLNIFNSEKIEDDYFDLLYRNLTTHFKEEAEPETINSISNLAILDFSTNRGYKNAMFPIKRKRILENDMTGVFVPICTKNVFLKSYSKKMVEVMYWKEHDANEYLLAIKQMLKEYLPIQETSHEQ